jgi:4-carboxymuconolactone decarboxylase
MDGPSPRIAAVEPGSRPEAAEVEARLMAARGEITALYRVLLNSPPVASGWEQLLTAVRQKTGVAPALRELMILRVAVLNGARYEFDAHVPFARRAGMSDAKIEAVREQDLAPCFDTDERLALELTDAMTRDITVPDALMAALKARLDDRALLEWVTTVAAYNMVSRLLVALQLGH